MGFTGLACAGGADKLVCRALTQSLRSTPFGLRESPSVSSCLQGLGFRVWGLGFRVQRQLELYARLQRFSAQGFSGLHGGCCAAG